ncbi:MAG: glycerophosphodiester phosphodiesterase [Acidobacteria bacterium]|nr:glycerophosphodiester phosphodiesterase [Acidobacteriota bacterium]
MTGGGPQTRGQPIWADAASSRPLVFAHRGGASLAPENTFPAFERGLEAGADGLELDVRLSRDGTAVVHHDPTLDRTTSASGRVDHLTARELAGVDAAYRFNAAEGYPLRGRGIGIPTLRAVLDRYRDRRLIIEMKCDVAALARAVIDEVRAAGAVDRVCLGAFPLFVLLAARRYEPQIATSASREETRLALYRSRVRWPITRAAYRAYQVPEIVKGRRIVSPRFIRHAHRAGLPVQVWTINEAPDMHRLLEWGVDALITDRPDLARQIVDARR